MNRNFKLIGENNIDKHKQFITDFSLLIKKNQIIDENFLKIVFEISNYNIINDDELSDNYSLNEIFDNKDSNKKTFKRKERNSRNLIDKINNSYLKYLKNLSILNISEQFSKLPHTLSVIYQIDKLDAILFQPIFYEYMNFYISNFNYKKIYSLRKNENMFYKDVPNLFYKQDLKKNNSKKIFEDWFSKPDLNIQKEYNSIFNNNTNDFGDKLTFQHMNFLKYSTDYLKSPFDIDKVNKIYDKSIKILKKENNRIFKFIKRKDKNNNLLKDSEKIIKLIIQENMLDFISENIFYEGFNMNENFYKNKENEIKKYENKKISFKLFELLNSYIYNISENEIENKILIDEYYSYVRKAISTSMLDFYNDLFLNYQIKYYDLNQDLDNNLKIKNLFIKYIEKYSKKLNKKNLKKYLKQTQDVNELPLFEIIEIYKFILNNIKDNFSFTINDEEIYLLKFSEYYSFASNKNINSVNNESNDFQM